MKKIILALAGLALAAVAAFLVWQNLPEKRFARHITKARLYAQEKNFTAARIEYEKAYNITGEYSPTASYEVLTFTNRMNIQEGRLAEALANTKAFVARAYNSKEAWVTLAELAFRAGEVDVAFEAVHKAIDLDPGYFPARLFLAQVRTQQGRLDLAEEQLRLLYKSHPDSLRTLLPLAENLLRQGQVDKAQEFLSAAIKDHPESNAARLMLVDSYLSQGKADSAHSILDAWAKSDPEMAIPILIRKAQIHGFRGQFDSARALLRPNLLAREENLPVFGAYALLQAKQGQYDSAVKTYSAYREIKPAAAEDAMRLSVYLNLKDNAPARALELLKTLQVSTRGGGLSPLLSATYLAIGQENRIQPLLQELPDSLRPSLEKFVRQLVPDKEFIGQWALVNYFTVLNEGVWAARATQDFYRRWPDAPLAQIMWAGQLTRLGRFGDAARILEKQKDPTVAQKVGLLSVYLKAGDAEKAMALAGRILAEDPRRQGINLLIADYHMARGARAKAVEHYTRELELDTGNIVCLNNLAWEYGIVQGDAAKAMPFLNRLRKLRNLDPRVQDTIGWILARNGQAADAVRYFEIALNIVPGYPSIHYHLGWTLSQMGKKEEAKKHLQAALSDPGPFDERSAAEKLLAEMG